LGSSAAARRPGRGRHAAAWDPEDLGVHEVIGGGRMPPDQLVSALTASASQL
jgi:hypothetical protein